MAHNPSSTTQALRVTADGRATTGRDRAPTEAVVVAAVATMAVGGGDAIAIGPIDLATITPDIATAAHASPVSITPAAIKSGALKGFPNPPAKGSHAQSSRDYNTGTLEGFL